MKLTNVLILVVTLLSAIATSAQQSRGRIPEPGEILWPKLEVAAVYSYVRFGPSVPHTQRHGLLGGGGSLTYNWNEYLGLKGEVTAYKSNKNAFVIPPNSVFPSGLSGTAQGNMLTYMIGPQFKVRSHFIQPFANLMAGGAHTDIYDIALKPLCSPTAGSCSAKAPTANAFALDFGGGVDMPINKFISLRPVQIDYLLTRFHNPISKAGNQSNFHYSAGLVFTLGWGTY